METRYKVIISNKNIYKEIELSYEQQVTVGTAVEVDVRLRKELFFENILLHFTRTDNNWSVISSDNIYFSLGDSRKLMNLQLRHGMNFKVCYQNSNNEVFHVAFMIDFEYEQKDYNRRLDIKSADRLLIGGTEGCSVQIQDGYLGKDSFALEHKGEKYILTDLGCRYGVYVNGNRVTDKAEIKDHDFFSVVGYSFYYSEGYLYTSTDKTIKCIGLEEKILIDSTTALDYPKFNRNTRIQYDYRVEEIEIQQPTSKPKEQKKSLLLSLIPTIVMLAMTIVLRGIIGGGGTFVIYSVVSMGMGMITSVITYRKDKKDIEKEIIEREEAYKEYIAEKEKKLQKMRDDELQVRRTIYESLEESVSEVGRFGKRIFEKTTTDKDFLQVYLGTGTIESVNQVKYNKQEFVDMKDPISLLPEKISNKYKYIEEAPIISNFYESCGVGIVGQQNVLSQMLKNITLDISIRHFYKDVRLVYVLDNRYIQEFEWVKWLKNVENASLDVRNIVCDEDSKNIVLESLYANLSAREAILDAQKDHEGFRDYYVVFVTNVEMISTHPISKYINESKKYGFTFVFFEEYEEKLPQGCTEVIRLESEENGIILKAANGDRVSAFKYPKITMSMAEATALRLGAMYVDEVSLEGQLTKNITMYELLGIMSVDDLDLKSRWSSSQVYKTMSAPIGVKSGNEIVSLNISDKGNGHGPHGLVAGTTGSGKSEILQTYILSLATLFQPDDVGFVIIDFKGGGMANQFEDLPHLIGTITNIDGREIDRSLLSIKAELVKRQEMFSKAGVNHINDYIKLFKAGKVDMPMPHLIMIVDEFAELKQEYPDFMKELISAARIGRTLGVHLILATQKPAGVVDAQIWSNSKFKLCLKVQTKEDSNEVLKSPLAAEIVEPGRAYFQVGNNEIFELVQSAYSGASVPDGSTNKEKIFTIYEKNIWGKKKAVYTNKKAKAESSNITQLDEIVNYISLYCKANDIERLPGICLPALVSDLRTESLNYDEQKEAGFTVPFGWFDDPEMQKQGMAQLDVSRDNVYVIGSSQMGKTVFLQTIAYGLIRKFSSEEINLYMIDCGSMVLKMFEESYHVGGVVLASEEEKCKNLFKLLNTIVVERKKVLSGKGIGNFASYLEAGYKDLPQVVVMIDNYAAFKEYFPEQNEQINSLTREAQGVGISFIITAATSNAMNYRTQANFGKKFALNCNDSGEYSNLFGHCKKTPAENVGRGLFIVEKRILEFQVAMFGKGNKEAERSQELKNYIIDRNKVSAKKATLIPMVPDKLILEEVMKENPQLFRQSGMLPIGMAFSTVEYVIENLNERGFLALLGDNECRVQFMNNFMKAMAANIVFHNIETIIIDDKQRNLADVGKLGFVRTYTNDAVEGLAYLADFYDLLEERAEEEHIQEMSTCMLVLNNAELMKQICSDKNMSKELASAIKQASEVKVFILFGQVENVPVGFNSSEVLKTLKEEKNGIVFAPISENKFYEVSGRTKTDPVFDKSMGYYFSNAGYAKIKIFE